MALIAVAADKGAPGVTTAWVALAAVWRRPVLLAECDPAGGDIVYRLPGAGGTRLDPRRGLLSLAVAARHGLQPDQVWEHTQKLHGGLDVLAGVTTAEQGAGLDALWDVVGGLLSRIPQADVIADCGRIGRDGPFYDLLAEAEAVVPITRASPAEGVRLRDPAGPPPNGLPRPGPPRARAGAGARPRPMRGGRHAGPQPAPGAWPEQQARDHPGPLPGPPSATVPGGPAAPPGEPGGW